MVEISCEGESYFEDGVSKCKLLVDYWIDWLINGKEYLYVIVFGMYCINI